MAENEPGPDTLGQDARITSLDARLTAAQADEAHRTGAGKAVPDDGSRLGNRVLAELIGGMVGGALIGWVIDRFAGTQPWGLLVMLALGTIVAFRNIIRISTKGSK
ncbi:AtpZ/AtpI family protein [Sphingomonas radiodurans]|uniref:AtpZ/AtpI family protein n=1 Tax=Sphingomonas radiodurans TaxID=2890321 RepID=UPI001E381F78|nr:AtpZ/AtpI family protein [Sphingomonas radiodurans]WBH15502.1 AtpZ/AtpI family protein [Sphingomonas radiodurans]